MSDVRFVLGVDLDGVCADFYGGLRPIAAEWLGVPESELSTEVSHGLKEWRLDALGGYSALHRFAVTQRDLFRKLKPIEGAPAALRRLSSLNIRIRIITHRLFTSYFHVEAVSQTVEWLEHWGIPYRDLCLMEDKAAVGADMYVEDAPLNVERLRADGHATIVFSNSTNRGLPGPRAENWSEVEQLVAAQLATWHVSGSKQLEGE
jgi:5'(3')-deoxyribonucleotidase